MSLISVLFDSCTFNGTIRWFLGGEYQSERSSQGQMLPEAVEEAPKGRWRDEEAPSEAAWSDSETTGFKWLNWFLVELIVWINF